MQPLEVTESENFADSTDITHVVVDADIMPMEPVSKRLEFWQASAPGELLKQRLLNPIGLILIAAIAAHTAFWLLLPNPIPRNSQVLRSKKVSIIPVVTLPPNLLNKPINKYKLPPLNSSNLPKLNSSQLSNPLSLPAPANSAPTSLPPPILSLPPQNSPQNSTQNLPVPGLSSSNLPTPGLSAPSSRIPAKPSNNLTFSAPGNNLKLDNNANSVTPRNSPPNQPSANNFNPNLIDNSSNLKLSPKDGEQTVDPLTGFSTKASDLVVPTNKSDDQSN